MTRIRTDGFSHIADPYPSHCGEPRRRNRTTDSQSNALHLSRSGFPLLCQIQIDVTTTFEDLKPYEKCIASVLPELSPHRTVATIIISKTMSSMIYNETSSNTG